MLLAIFYVCSILILYTWIVYPLILVLASRFKAGGNIPREYDDAYKPSVSIIIAAYNEQDSIEQRIRNLLDQDYGDASHEIIVASDGSSDATNELVEKYRSAGVKLLAFEKNRGKAIVHNDAVASAQGEIILFSDAGTLFQPGLVGAILNYFRNPSVGCVVGKLKYESAGTAISESEGIYFKLENIIREKESLLGLLATGTGSCLAVRKRLWRNLEPVHDSDFITPIDVVLQNHKVVLAPDVVVHDKPPVSVQGEFRSRVRMTSKNFMGTILRFGVRGWIDFPCTGFALLSHKIFRWLTPFFLLGVWFANAAALDEGCFYLITFMFQNLFYALAFAGWLAERAEVALPVASQIFSFCVAMAGMGAGVIKGLFGRAPASFKTVE